MKAATNTLAAHRKRRFDIWDVLIRFALIMASLVCLLPFIHVAAKSLSDDAFVIANKVFLWPQGFTLEAYGKIFADASILRSLYVSVVVTVLFTILGMIITICAAYPLSRKQLKGRTALTFLFMFTLYFGGGIIPEYMLISNLGMLDTWWALILPQAFSAFNLLIMKTAIANSIPTSLEESARIDGAGHFRILWSIVLPLSKPIIATLSLFYAVGRWNAYQDALFYIKQRVDLRPLQLKLYYLVIQASESFQLEATQVSLSNPEVLKASCVVFATLPILCMYPFIQKYFVQGVMLGAVKE
ncbi:carbohydrate ABC transporter permease [Paenibacillus macerans]|uniref:Binding--dependent transport system inner membrane component family protein n=1 Tax=Paenibacillus macerans TaxID=44252 RepID=A0A090YDG6_PAEMA|nr:carbohydrate ABC transporter permease [Paenibacillus macerans]KFM95902.1 binding--dependent transport system inner membrane component family protein [Paenibacillus macerans]MCY7558770.1 carbohydrate ABC transporter permease [Paenibacillus macerans]MEC0149798.1 carbohydrate ABC transporter permease [Paenibacillus macerans]SUA83996.1 binding-protein-dependent transport system inner membrane protein [Paenibacillus macerans]